jgi:broad specificity phosphatase PhoE
MIRILLIRHAVTDLTGRVLYGRMPGVHISAAGAAQAQGMARAIQARYGLAEVISSPMDRALETARPLAGAQGVPISIDERLNELDFGDWMGKEFVELQELAAWKRYYKLRATTRPPCGESMMDVQSRAWGAIASAMERHPQSGETSIAMVTHGDVVRALLLLVLGMSIDHIHRIEAAPASVSEIVVQGADLRVRTMNETFPVNGVSDF